MKKLLFFILFLSLLTISFANVSEDNGSIDVNVTVLPHVTMTFNPTDQLLNSWKKVNSSNETVNEIDPSLRDVRYYATGVNAEIKTNANIEIKSAFIVNTEFMDQSFYNPITGVIDENVVSGGISFIEDSDEYGFYPLAISSTTPKEYTTIIHNYDGTSGFNIQYSMNLRFTEDNWYKIKAGEDITIGYIEVIINTIE